MIEPPRFLGVAQVAKALGVSEMTLRRRIKENAFPAVRVGRRYVIPADALSEMTDKAMRSWRAVNAADWVVPTAA